MNLKCCPCTDDMITAGGSPDDTELPDAITIVPTMQTFGMDGQQIAAPIALPVCFACREKQLGKVSKQGLLSG